MTGKSCIICVAITGSVPTRAHNPNLSISIAEQGESTQAAFEAGATIVHAPARDDEGLPTSDPERFARLMEGVRRRCPGMIVQLSTGGRSGAGRTRGGMLPLRPDMASLSVGSNSSPARVYENPSDLVDGLALEMRVLGVKPEIEVFDLSHIHQAAAMAAGGRPASPHSVLSVLGVKNAMPADSDVFNHYIRSGGGAGCRMRNGVRRGSGGTRSSCMAGALRQVATQGRGWRTICRLTARHLSHRVRRWRAEWSSFSPAMPGP
jgi:3-keto-5-aminohexanoate cleavage enzyme